MNKPIKIKTENGRYADSLIEENIDMSWNSFEEMVATFHVEEIDYHVYFN